MKYVGSKARIGKQLADIINQYRSYNQLFVEPFCGGCNLTQYISDPRLCCDNNYYLISMWRELQNGWIPPTYVSEEYYDYVKDNIPVIPPHIVAYVGFNSYGAKFFGGYCRDSEGLRDYWMEHYNNITKQVPKLKNVSYFYGDYTNIELTKPSIIYCDPPYDNSTKYSTSKNFNYRRFYTWCDHMKNLGHVLFLSEYSAPPCFKEIWSDVQYSSLTKDTGSKYSIERLFILK